MSPRAAWRLETLGFAEVYDYIDGKVDWMAAGLPTEGTNAQKPRAGDIARKDVPTCGLTEKLGEVATRVRALGWDAVVVVNEQRVVLGLLRTKELAADQEQSIEKAMRPGPSTFRPYVSLHDMLHFMIDHKLESSPITTSDGRLVGLLMQKDVAAEMEKMA
jgi:predicted transcriptional regulator